MKKLYTDIPSKCVYSNTPEKNPGLFFKINITILTRLLFPLFFSISCQFLFTACTTAGQSYSNRYPQYKPETFPLQELVPSEILWQQVRPGLDRLDFTNPKIPLVWHAVRINLTAGHVQVLSWPESINDNRGITPLLFSRHTGAEVTVNATPFSIQTFFPRKLVPVGIYICQGKELFPPDGKYCALLFYNNPEKNCLKADIIDSQTELTSGHLFPDYAFGGFWTILRKEKIGRFLLNRDSRTVIGISDNGSILYILVVEGEYKHKSRGLSLMECAGILQKAGAETAMSFDGGYSTELCIQGKSVLTYRARRRNANCLGFKFQP